MLEKTQTGISDFRISGQSFIKENCHNSRTIDDTDMKLGPINKLEKGNKTKSRNLAMTSCQRTVTSLSFFWLMANLEQSGSRFPDAYSVKLILSLIVVFYLTHSSHVIALGNGTIFAKNADFLQRNAEISKK